MLKRRAEAHLVAGRYADAIEAYRQWLAATPADADAWYNLGYCYRMGRRFAEALDAYGQALDHKVAGPEAVHVNRAAIWSEHLHQSDAAEVALRAAIAAAPRFAPAWLNLGQVYEDIDRRDDAGAAYRSVLAFDPEQPRAHARLAALEVFAGEAAVAIGRLRPLVARARHPGDAAELGFALAHAFDAAGDYAAAFAAAGEANAHARRVSRVSYDPAAHDRLVDAIIAARWPINPHAEAGGQSLFVCGMFRSGSTLCEQVLARHSRVTAGGELETIPALVAGPLAPYPASAVTADDMARLGRAYRAEVEALFPNADIVTDKRCDNAQHVGLIKAMLPGARIVRTVRDPRDTALSIWFLHFADTISYGWRLEDIVHYAAACRRLERHWQALHPDVVAFDYDAFVRGPEAEARTMFDALGLDWQARCDPRGAVSADVRTASAWQVRQPVHARSAGRWRNYARWLEPYRAAMEAE